MPPTLIMAVLTLWWVGGLLLLWGLLYASGEDRKD